MAWPKTTDVTTKSIRSRVLNAAKTITEQRKMTEFDVSWVQGGSMNNVHFMERNGLRKAMYKVQTQKRAIKRAGLTCFGETVFFSICDDFSFFSF